MVDDNVDLAEPRHDLVIGATKIGGDRHIGLRRGNARASTLRDDFDCSVEGLRAPRDNGNVGAAGCEPPRDSEPDALASAGDHGRPAGEIELRCYAQPTLQITR